MAPKHHPTPLSGGGRKALNKELGKARAMTNTCRAVGRDADQGRDHAAAGRQVALRILERAHVGRRRADRPFADHRSGRQRRLPLVGDPVLALQDAERRGLGWHEASADHVRSRPGQQTAMPQMRQGGPTPAGDPAAACAAVTSRAET